MKKIYVWGTGVVLARVLENWMDINSVIAFVDNNPEKKEYLGKPVILPEKIQEPFDAIVIANMHAREIRQQCIELGICLDKVVFLYNNVSTVDFNSDYQFVEEILGKRYSEIVKERYKVVREISLSEKNGANDSLKKMPMYKDDYVRVKTLELIARLIEEEKIEGSIAELGVFKGEFSRCLNCVFPNRKLFLFDTFEGFDNNEAKKEKSSGTCGDAFIEAFRDTNVEKVIDKLEHKDGVIVCKGLFPKSAENLKTEKYAFVSLDVDFEESTYCGLEYFYPRLSAGGFIMIHDYNYGYFDAVKNALKRFETDNGIKMAKVPIADAIGTIVITK